MTPVAPEVCRLNKVCLTFVPRFKQEDILVRLGQYDFNQAGETEDQTFRVANMRLHRQYDNTTLENDIAVIKLDRAATLTNSVRPICMPRRSETFTNQQAFAIGWGRTYFGGPTSSILLEVISLN